MPWKKKAKSKEQEGYENINELRMARYKRPEGRIPVGRYIFPQNYFNSNTISGQMEREDSTVRNVPISYFPADGKNNFEIRHRHAYECDNELLTHNYYSITIVIIITVIVIYARWCNVPRALQTWTYANRRKAERYLAGQG